MGRRYRLLCPIARSLDVLGDRWALLILRDLHAGPARFQELRDGLGIATNLLATRLGELLDNGLVQRQGDDRQAAYELTELGWQTDDVLWALARFGQLLPPDAERRPPGNARTLVLTLRKLFQSLDEPLPMKVVLHVDGDVLSLHADGETTRVDHGLAVEDPDLEIRTSYESFVAAAEGRLDADTYRREHLEVLRGGDRLEEFVAIRERALQALGAPEK